MHSPRRRLLPLSANKQVQAVVSFWFSIADRGSAVVPVQLEGYDPVPALRKFMEKDDSQIRVLIVLSRAAACDDSASDWAERTTCPEFFISHSTLTALAASIFILISE